MKTNSEASRIISKAYNHQLNFVTPEVLARDFVTPAKTLAYEISHGKFLSDHIYGVSIVDVKTGTPAHKLCQSFPSLDEAIAYIDGLAKQAGEL